MVVNIPIIYAQIAEKDFMIRIHYFIADIFEADIGTIPHNFLNTLLKQHLRNPCKPKLLEQLKQAIRETDWKV